MYFYSTQKSRLILNKNRLIPSSFPPETVFPSSFPTETVQYQPKQCFETFVNGVVEARRQGDLNPDSAVCANIEKVVGNSAYGYQIMDRSTYTRTKYVIGSCVNTLVNDKMFRKFNELPNELYEVELGKSKVEHKEPIIVGFFILQYAKLVMLELVYNFFRTILRA